MMDKGLSNTCIMPVRVLSNNGLGIAVSFLGPKPLFCRDSSCTATVTG